MHTKMRPVAIAVLVVAVQTLLVAYFAWPALKTEPRDLPIVVTGPAAPALAQQLDQVKPGAFDVTTVADAAAADAALRDRDAYAAFITGPEGLTLHVASAASPVVAQLFTQQAQQLGNGHPVTVVDIVAADPDDPRGVALTSAFLPLMLTSVAAGVLLTLLVRGRRARLAGLVTFALLAGAAAGAVLEAGYGALPGSYLAIAGVLALTAGAITAGVVGLGAIFGRAGAALGGALVFLIANPLSGLTSAPEMLPRPWGLIGQLLPPGAGATMLRSVAFFDGAGAARAAWALAIWIAAGLALAAIGNRGALGVGPQSPAPADAPDLASDAASPTGSDAAVELGSRPAWLSSGSSS